MSKGRITKEQLSDSLLNFITQNAGSGTSGGAATIEFKKNSVTVQSSVTQVAIGISGFDKSKDLLMVYKNSVYLEENVIYTITSDSLYIQKIEGSWNESGSSLFNFIVIKGGATGTSGGSSTIGNGTITKAKLATELQTKIDQIDTLAQKDIEFSSQLEHITKITHIISNFPRLQGETNDYNRFIRALEKMNNGDNLLLLNEEYDMGGNDLVINKRITLYSNSKPFFNRNDNTRYGSRLFNGGIILNENGITISKIGVYCPDLDNGFQCNNGEYNNILIEDCFSVARDHSYLFESYKGEVKNINVVRCYSANSIHGFISKASNVNFTDCLAEGHSQYGFGNISDNMSNTATQMALNYDNTVKNCQAFGCNYGFITYSRDKTNIEPLSRVFNLKYDGCSANNCTNPMKIGENEAPSGYASIRPIDSIAISDFVSYFSSGEYSIQLVNVANIILEKTIVSKPILYGNIISTGVTVNKDLVLIKKFANVESEIVVNCTEATFYELQARADDATIATKTVTITKNIGGYNVPIKIFIRSNSGNPTFAGFTGDCISPTTLNKTLTFGTGILLEWVYFESIGKYLCVNIQNVKYT